MIDSFFSKKQITLLKKTQKNKYNLIINTTTFGKIQKNFITPQNIFNKNVLCYDLFYGYKKTKFIKLAKKNKAKKIYNGLGMLIFQAAYSFNLWTGIFPNVKLALRKFKIDNISINKYKLHKIQKKH